MPAIDAILIQQAARREVEAVPPAPENPAARKSPGFREALSQARPQERPQARSQERAKPGPLEPAPRAEETAQAPPADPSFNEGPRGAEHAAEQPPPKDTESDSQKDAVPDGAALAAVAVALAVEAVPISVSKELLPQQSGLTEIGPQVRLPDATAPLAAESAGDSETLPIDFAPLVGVAVSRNVGQASTPAEWSSPVEPPPADLVRNWFGSQTVSVAAAKTSDAHSLSMADVAAEEAIAAPPELLSALQKSWDDREAAPIDPNAEATPGGNLPPSDAPPTVVPSLATAIASSVVVPPPAAAPAQQAELPAPVVESAPEIRVERKDRRLKVEADGPSSSTADLDPVEGDAAPERAGNDLSLGERFAEVRRPIRAADSDRDVLPSQFSQDIGSRPAGPQPLPEAPPLSPREAVRSFANVAPQVIQGIQTAQISGQGVRLQLDPPDLGRLNIDVSIREGTVTARLEATSQSTVRLLQDNIGQLRDALVQQGVTLDRLVVEHRGEGLGLNLANRQSDQPQQQERENQARQQEWKLEESPTSRGTVRRGMRSVAGRLDVEV